MNFFCLLSLLFLVNCCSSFTPSEFDIAGALDEPLSCSSMCSLPMDWAEPRLGLCGQDNNNYYNALCNSAFASYGQCLIKNLGIPTPNVGISYPGDCGCPNYCYNVTTQGTCSGGQCECNLGWSGTDCSQINLLNMCSGHGVPKNISGIINCECDDTFALSDCSASIGELPPITQTITPAQQYSSWDEYGNDNPIFNDTTIAVIHLTMPAESLEFMLNPENRKTDVYLPVSMWFNNGAVLEVMDNVGFRLKGGASRNYVKKTWKLNFDKFEDRKWAQQKKIEIKSLEQDPSGIKEKLCLSLLYSLNAPAQRSSYAQLFINGQAMGAFLIEETIDDQFLKSRFGNEDGALFKCTAPLAYLGPDPQLYNSTIYEPGTDLADTTIGLSLIRDLTYIINSTSDEQFATALPTVLDVDLYVRTLAFEVLTGNWDGLWNRNNYYLYWNPDVSVFQYFRHDMDMSFGAFEPLFSFADVPIYTWGDGGKGYRLINRVLAVQPFRQMFTDYCYQLIETYYNLEGNFLARMQALNQQIDELMLRDQWRSTDFGWTYSEFEEMQTKPIIRVTGGVWAIENPEVSFMALQEFMNIRIQSALQQLDPPSK